MPGLKFVACVGVGRLVLLLLILYIFSLSRMLICTLLNHLILATPNLMLSLMPSPLFTSLPPHALTILHSMYLIHRLPVYLKLLVCTHMHKYLYIHQQVFVLVCLYICVSPHCFILGTRSTCTISVHVLVPKSTLRC